LQAPPQVTAPEISIATPTVPIAGKEQLSQFDTAEEELLPSDIHISPQHFSWLSPPQSAFTDMKNSPAEGFEKLSFFSSPDKQLPVLQVKVALEELIVLSPHFTVGRVIAAPLVPSAAKPVQVRIWVGPVLELLGAVPEELGKAEELLTGQDSTTCPNTRHAFSEYCLQVLSGNWQNAKPLCEEPPEETPCTAEDKLPSEEELSAFFKTSSADSISVVQEYSKPIAITDTAKAKNLFMRTSCC
jgi:hypothetical protein